MTASRRQWIRAALVAAAGAALASCSRPQPVKGQFVLEPALPPPVAKTQQGLLRVGSLTVAAPFRGRQFVFRETDLKFETDYYNEFLVAPGANIGEATARALAAAKVFTAVAPASVTVDPDWLLDGFVESLYGDGRNMSKPVAVLTIVYFLRPVAGDAGVPVWSRRYERQVPFTTGSAADYVAAQNKALGEILAELARDLSGLTLTKM
ncbi:MAG: membrane integrity-associated transporter subunit PqiC [Burkholderiales bacterium]|nr:membrane integrity-associated transporter subunit PqiC [Burkholderiales bacterium]